MSIQSLDELVLLWLNGLPGLHWFLDLKIEFIGVYAIYLVPISLVYLWFQKVREVGIRAAVAGLATFLVASPIVGAVWFRPRPLLAELGGTELLFHRPTYSFPSDHAGFLAALTLTFYLNGYRKVAAAFLVLTVFVSLTRVALGFHYPTDILGGWLLGVAVAWILHRYRDFLDRYLSRPAIGVAQRIKLA